MDRRRLKTARPVAQLRQGRTDWYRITNHADAPAEVLIYDEIGYFGVSANDFVRDLQALATDEIHLRINSPGGDVFDGIAILNSLRNHSARVNVTVDGLAASSASFIAMAGDHIVMGRNSELMIHDAWGMAIGNAADMRDLADRLDSVSDNIASIYAERTGGTVEEWRALMQAESWYSADEAVAAGLADVVQGQEPKDSPKDSWDLSIFNFTGRAAAPEPVTTQPEPQDDLSWFNPDLFRDAMKEATDA